MQVFCIGEAAGFRCTVEQSDDVPTGGVTQVIEKLWNLLQFLVPLSQTVRRFAAGNPIRPFHRRRFISGTSEVVRRPPFG
jgi:hypothetical protein